MQTCVKHYVCFCTHHQHIHTQQEAKKTMPLSDFQREWIIFLWTQSNKRIVTEIKRIMAQEEAFKVMPDVIEELLLNIRHLYICNAIWLAMHIYTDSHRHML